MPPVVLWLIERAWDLAGFTGAVAGVMCLLLAVLAWWLWAWQKRSWPRLHAFAGIGSSITTFTLGGLAVGIALHEPAKPDGWAEPYKPVLVAGKSFQNEVVALDGYAYQSCRFQNVTFRYEGTTPVYISRSIAELPLLLKSDNRTVLETAKICEVFTNYAREKTGADAGATKR